MNNKNKVSNKNFQQLGIEKKDNYGLKYASQFRYQFKSTHEQFNSMNSMTKKMVSDTQNSFFKPSKSTLNNFIKTKTQNKLGLVAAERIKKYSSLFVDQFDNEFHKKIEKLYERSLETQKKLQEIFGEVNEKYEYFHKSGWLIPNGLFPQELKDIQNKKQANEFMMNNIIHNRKLLFVSLKNCLYQDEMPYSIRILLSNIINALEKDDDSYKIMLPTIFSILDFFATQLLSEYVKFSYLSRESVEKIKKCFQDSNERKNNQYDSGRLQESSEHRMFLKDFSW